MPFCDIQSLLNKSIYKAGLEKTLGANSAAGEELSKQGWCVSKSCTKLVLDMKNIGKCCSLPDDQTMDNKAPSVID